MINIKSKYILLLFLIIFILYHIIGNCNNIQGDGFSIGADILQNIILCDPKATIENQWNCKSMKNALNSDITNHRNQLTGYLNNIYTRQGQPCTDDTCNSAWHRRMYISDDSVCNDYEFDMNWAAPPNKGGSSINGDCTQLKTEDECKKYYVHSPLGRDYNFPDPNQWPDGKLMNTDLRRIGPPINCKWDDSKKVGKKCGYDEKVVGPLHPSDDAGQSYLKICNLPSNPIPWVIPSSPASMYDAEHKVGSLQPFFELIVSPDTNLAKKDLDAVQTCKPTKFPIDFNDLKCENAIRAINQNRRNQYKVLTNDLKQMFNQNPPELLSDQYIQPRYITGLASPVPEPPNAPIRTKCHKNEITSMHSSCSINASINHPNRTPGTTAKNICENSFAYGDPFHWSALSNLPEPLEHSDNYRLRRIGPPINCKWDDTNKECNEDKQIIDGKIYYNICSGGLGPEQLADNGAH